jgi:hypothetical protein
MEEKTILKLSDLRDELCDIIAQIKKENSDKGNSMMSMLDECGLVNASRFLIFPSGHFTDWLREHNFIESITEDEVRAANVVCMSGYKSRSSMVQYEGSTLMVHPALLYVYLNIK